MINSTKLSDCNLLQSQVATSASKTVSIFDVMFRNAGVAQKLEPTLVIDSDSSESQTVAEPSDATTVFGVTAEDAGVAQEPEPTDKPTFEPVLEPTFELADGIESPAEVASPSGKNSRYRFQSGTVRTTESTYENEAGSPWLKVVRKDGIDALTGEPIKTFFQWKMVNGSWEKGAPSQKYPYRLPEILRPEVDTILIVEGEKATDSLREVLHAAGVTNTAVTTSPGGSPSGKLWKKFVQQHPVILGKRIRIFPDNDDPGRKYSREVAVAFLEAKPDADVRIVSLDGLPEGGDFVDWYANFVADGKDESAAVETLKAYCEHPDFSEKAVLDSATQPEPTMNVEITEFDIVSENTGIVVSSTGHKVLDSFLQQIAPVKFAEDAVAGAKLSHRDYYIGSIFHLLDTARQHRWDIGMRNEIPHVFTGKFWERVDRKVVRHFVQDVGTLQRIPGAIIKDHLFVEKLMKQFVSEARFPVLSTDNTPKINLRNGTLHFTPEGAVLKPFSKWDGLTYQLPYDFDPTAVAPLFRSFLERVLPDAGSQKLVFQYIGYVFLRSWNLEKVLFLYGGGANGKSVFLNTIRALIGVEQCCDFSLEGITGSEYQRAALGNHLLNVSTEISTRMGAEIFKKMAVREPLQARSPYGKPFNVTEYATSIFAMNELPKEVEQTDGFFRRFLIVPFNVQIPVGEQDPCLTKKIIDSEMSGVLNYVLDGMKSLIDEGNFDIPATVLQAVNDFRLGADSVLTYIDESGLRSSTKNWIPLQEMYGSYKQQCLDEGSRQVSMRTFTQRLRNLGFVVKKTGHLKQTVVYAERADD